MTPADVLARARGAGVELLIYNGRLASCGSATPELRAAIRAHKPSLVALLTGEPRRLPELPPLPADDEHARWLRGEISFARSDSIAWTDREDVRLAVEDLTVEGMRPGTIARTLGLTRGEVVAILRCTGR